MKIIIEGVDRIGKTTLAKKIAKKYKLDYVHMNINDPKDFEFYKQTLRKTNVIFDRHFIGEMIYPSVFNRERQLDMEGFIKLMEFCYEEEIKIIVLYSNDHELLNKRMRRERYRQVRLQYQLINNAFYTIGKDNPQYINLLNVSDKEFKSKLKEVLK